MSVASLEAPGLKRAMIASAVLHALLIGALGAFFMSEQSKSLLGEKGLPAKRGGGEPITVGLAAPPPPPKVKATPPPTATPEPERSPEPTPEPTPEPKTTPEPPPKETPPPPEEKAMEVAKAKPKENPKPTPRPTATPKPTEAAKATPKPTEAPKPKEKPKETEKPKATPKATPAPKATEGAISPSKAHALVPPKDPPTREGAKSAKSDRAESALKPGVASKGGAFKPNSGSTPGSGGGAGGGGSARVGSNEMRGVGLPDFYARTALATIGRNFRVPADKQRDIDATVAFTIRADGTLENIRIRHGTGSAELDEFALEALRRTKRLAPLPDSMDVKSLDAEVTFNFLEG